MAYETVGDIIENRDKLRNDLAAVTAERDQLRAEVERLRASLLQSIPELLTEHEASFVARVYRQPGSKLNDDGIASHWEDDGTEYGNIVCHWHRPEALGLIKCVGSYKWEPTGKLVLAASVRSA